jgi:hypothetical protein
MYFFIALAGLSYGVKRAVGLLGSVLLFFPGFFGAPLSCLASIASSVRISFGVISSLLVGVDLFLEVLIFFVHLVTVPPLPDTNRQKPEQND